MMGSGRWCTICAQLAFQTGYASIKGTEYVDGTYNVVLGPPNNEVAGYLKDAYAVMFPLKDRAAYVDALFLGNYDRARDELQQTLRALSADMVPRNGTAVDHTRGGGGAVRASRRAGFESVVLCFPALQKTASRATPFTVLGCPQKQHGT